MKQKQFKLIFFLFFLLIYYCYMVNIGQGMKMALLVEDFVELNMHLCL